MKPTPFRCIAVLLSLLLMRAAPAFGEASVVSKQALLIANADYAHFGKLPNPISDARQLASALESIGFQVELVENANREQMLDALAAFEGKLKATPGIAFFHYGGHGVQVDGKNFLIPADADIPDEKRVATRAVEMDEVMATLDAAGASANIVVLDACRDNPLPATSSRSATRGLSVAQSKPKNSIIIYAAEAGRKAVDGLFTPALAKALTIPGKTISDLVTEVRREVYERSGGSQTPGEYNQLFEQIVLAGEPADSLDALRRKTQDAEEAKAAAEQLAVSREAEMLRQRAAKAEREKLDALRRAEEAERTAQANSAPPQHVQESAPDDGLEEFFRAYMNSYASNDSWEKAGFFAPTVSYCYANGGKGGSGSRADVAEDFRKFIASYPQRQYTNITLQQIQRQGEGVARINYSFNYRYNGKKLALGSADARITVEKINGQWLVTQFDETVHRIR